MTSSLPPVNEQRSKHRIRPDTVAGATTTTPRMRTRRVVAIALGAVAVLVSTFVSVAVWTSQSTPAALTVDNGTSEVTAHEQRDAAPNSAAPAKPAGTPKAVAPAGTGSGPEAASKLGWQRIGGDEFTTGKSSMWRPYNGPGHAGQGRRSPAAITTSNGILTITGDSSGTTGGMAWGQGRKYGKWEVRAKMPKGDRQYHPVLILWPSQVAWPVGGEIDFAETTSASNDVSFFLHYGASNSQKQTTKALDISQWHNYAVDWRPGRITGYIDGVEWFSTTEAGVMPPGPMHLTLQLDYFPGGGAPATSRLLVDWVRMYS